MSALFLYITVISHSLFCLALADLIITGVIDGPMPGGRPKAFEFYALNDIPDISDYSFRVSFNGASPSVPYTFQGGAVSAGTFLWLTDTADGGSFLTYFGFNPTFNDATRTLVNGDDPFELLRGGEVIDSYGERRTDGTGRFWEYTDAWAYRKNETGAQGTSFQQAFWSFTGADALAPKNDAGARNSNRLRMPLGSYRPASTSPTMQPTGVPTTEPTVEPTIEPSSNPTQEPTIMKMSSTTGSGTGATQTSSTGSGSGTGTGTTQTGTGTTQTGTGTTQTGTGTTQPSMTSSGTGGTGGTGGTQTSMTSTALEVSVQTTQTTAMNDGNSSSGAPSQSGLPVGSIIAIVCCSVLFTLGTCWYFIKRPKSSKVEFSAVGMTKTNPQEDDEPSENGRANQGAADQDNLLIQ